MSLKLLLVLFLVFIPAFVFYRLRGFSDYSGLGLLRARSKLPQPARVILITVSITALILVFWGTVNSVSRQHSLYEKSADYKLKVPTLPVPVPEKPDGGGSINVSDNRFLIQIIMVRNHDMLPLYSHTVDTSDVESNQFECQPFGTIRLKPKDVWYRWREINGQEFHEIKMSSKKFNIHSDLRVLVNIKTSQISGNPLSLRRDKDAISLVAIIMPALDNDPLKNIPASEFLSQNQGKISESILYDEIYYGRLPFIKIDWL